MPGKSMCSTAWDRQRLPGKASRLPALRISRRCGSVCPPRWRRPILMQWNSETSSLCCRNRSIPTGNCWSSPNCASTAGSPPRWMSGSKAVNWRKPKVSSRRPKRYSASLKIAWTCYSDKRRIPLTVWWIPIISPKSETCPFSVCLPTCCSTVRICGPCAMSWWQRMRRSAGPLPSACRASS